MPAQIPRIPERSDFLLFHPDKTQFPSVGGDPSVMCLRLPFFLALQRISTFVGEPRT